MNQKALSRTGGVWPSIFGSDPMQALRQEMNDVLGRFSSDNSWFGGDKLPAMDLSETDAAFEIKLDAPGFKAEEIDVEVRGNFIQVHGEHKEEKKEDKGKTYHRIERRCGSFNRSLTLPCRVNEQKVAAEYKEGVLTVHLPKVEGAKTHQIKVQS